MKSLRKFSAAVVLMCALGLSAFAGNVETPPCPVPGEIETPPCITTQVMPDEGVAPGEMNAPPAANAGTGYSVTEIALGAIQSMLSIF
jgi:hypothetical protein